MPFTIRLTAVAVGHVPLDEHAPPPESCRSAGPGVRWCAASSAMLQSGALNAAAQASLRGSAAPVVLYDPGALGLQQGPEAQDQSPSDRLVRLRGGAICQNCLYCFHGPMKQSVI